MVIHSIWRQPARQPATACLPGPAAALLPASLVVHRWVEMAFQWPSKACQVAHTARLSAYLELLQLHCVLCLQLSSKLQARRPPAYLTCPNAASQVAYTIRLSAHLELLQLHSVLRLQLLVVPLKELLGGDGLGAGKLPPCLISLLNL